MSDILLRGCLAMERGRKNQAYRHFLSASKAGDRAAFHNLAYCYDVGFGTSRNRSRALVWYKRAWRSGELASASNIALVFEELGSTPRARYWWKKAIAKGDGDAALDLAKRYIKTRRKDSLTKAKSLLKVAALAKRITSAARDEALKLGKLVDL